MTPSRPAPSKRRNQSEAMLESSLPESDGSAASRKTSSDSSSRAAVLEGLASQIPVALAEQIEEDNGGRGLLREQLDAGCGRMKTQLQCFEIERRHFSR